MKKSLLPFSIKQKKKNFLTLYIRFGVLIAIALFYIISATLIDSNVKQNSQDDVFRSRHILALNAVEHITESPRNTTNPQTQNATNATTHDHHKNCTNAAILELPSDGLTRDERKHGWILIHFTVAIYCFWLLATICDDYFVPCIEAFCSQFNMNEDVVGATFMAVAASSAELFINLVGTFITKSDLGVGTVVGSAVFNVLAVPACCGLFAGQLIYLDWWPVSRDCAVYAVAVVSLIVVLQDGRIMWYEAMTLVLIYLLYIAVMYWNDTMSQKARTVMAKLRRQSRVRPYRERSEITPLLATTENGKQNGKANGTSIHMDNSLYPINEVFNDYADSPWEKAHDQSVLGFILRWPITFILWFTIPDCRKHPKLIIVTFMACIFWIGIASYVVAMAITIIGDTLEIPDSVMGLTFLAAGTSVPEAVSSVIVAKQGHGAMGISSSIGSNTFDILLCLGLPWFIKSYFDPTIPGHYYIELNSTGLSYSAISLLSTLVALYLAFAFNKFKLDWKIGLTCVIMYISFLAFASLVELNVFFPVNLPTCPH